MQVPKPTHKKHKVSKTELWDIYKAVAHRDGYKCQLHDTPYYYMGELSWSIFGEIHHNGGRIGNKLTDASGMVLLCKECHRKVHKNIKKYRPILLKIMEGK